MIMKRIFIATNANKIVSGVEKRYHSKMFTIAQQLENSQLLGYCESSESFVSVENDNEATGISLFIVFDSIQKLTVGIGTSDDYLLRHTIDNDALIGRFSNGNIKQGRNTTFPKDLYSLVWPIVLEEGDQKADRILKLLFPPEDDILEAKLNLLHLCLTPDGVKKISGIKNYHLIQSIVENIKVEEEAEESILEYLGKTNPEDCFSQGYISALTKLRFVLLG